MKTIVDARRIYQDSATRGATPIELVVLLYDSAIEDMRSALTAMQKSDIEARAKQIGHASDGACSSCKGRWTSSAAGARPNSSSSSTTWCAPSCWRRRCAARPELMQQQIGYMSEVRDCWVQARRVLEPRPGAVTPAASAASAGGRLEQMERIDESRQSATVAAGQRALYPLLCALLGSSGAGHR